MKYTGAKLLALQYSCSYSLLKLLSMLRYLLLISLVKVIMSVFEQIAQSQIAAHLGSLLP